MGWHVRKSFKLGPFRINLSNSGISSSIGIKGARLSFSKRGTFATFGLNGIYYRKKLSMKTVSEHFTNANNLAEQIQRAANKKSFLIWLGVVPSLVAALAIIFYLDHVIETNKVYSPWLVISKNFVHIRETPSTSGNILLTVKKSDRFRFIERTENNWFKIRYSESDTGFVKDGLGFIAPRLASSETIKPLNYFPKIRQAIVLVSISLMVGYCIWLARRDRARRTVELSYQVDENLKNVHNRFLDCFSEVLSSQKIWTTLSKETTYQTKYHAGASQLISRTEIKSISSDQKPLTTFRTNVQIPYMSLNHLSFFFFPDQLIVQRDKNFASIPYKNLRIEVKDTRFVEEGLIPKDANIVDYTWKYLNKNGDPDLRFSINPRLPVCLYSEYNFQSTEGLNVIITTSKPGSMNRFAAFLNAIGEYQEKVQSNV
jgi:hypothetical protein